VRSSYDVAIVGGAVIGFADAYFLSAVSYVDPDVPHGPEELIITPVRYLAVVCYPRSAG
jgi:hypothetical protein